MRGARLAAAGAIVAVTVAGCSSGSHKSAAPGGGAPASTVATRWWSNSAVKMGSTIDRSHPDAAAGKLHPSDKDYCGMLSDTLKSGKSILPGVRASDPALLQATTAFIAEIQKAAPAAVRGAWDVLGPVVLDLAKSGGSASAMPTVNTAELTRAATTVAHDATTRCGLDLSQVTAANTH